MNWTSTLQISLSSRCSVCSRCPSAWPVKLYSRASLASPSSVFHRPPSSQCQRFTNSRIRLPRQRPHFSALIFILVTFLAAATKDMTKTTWERRLSFCSWFGRIQFLQTGDRAARTESCGAESALRQEAESGECRSHFTFFCFCLFVCLFNMRPPPNLRDGVTYTQGGSFCLNKPYWKKPSQTYLEVSLHGYCKSHE